MKPDRAASVAAWLLVTAGLAILVGHLKPLPQVVMVLAPLLPWVMPQRARAACVVGLLLLAAALLGFSAGFSLATTLFPARTSDGHAVMPVVVHGGSPAKQFLTMWKEIEDEPVDGKAPHAVGADGTRLSR